MEGFDLGAPLWDFSSNPHSLATLADDDFLALLQKQFTPDIGATGVDPLAFSHDGVDPTKLSNLPPPGPPPPLSDDSSPSPPSINESGSRRQSAIYSNGVDSGDDHLKRKASEEDFEEGPSHKTPHLAGKKGPARRKSGSNQDESRLLKRKEQNRAAQRAFRERKEKHVKDLEDKVASLEAKNDLTQTENEHLRELLQRLQEENVVLKQAQFTFSMPRQSAGTDNQGIKNTSTFNLTPDASFPGASASTSKNATPASSSLDTPSNFPSDIDFGSLTPFDSSSLSMAEDSSSVDRNMSYDFGFGHYVPSNTPYKTIASNPRFMSFADPILTDVTVASHLQHANKSAAQSPQSNGNNPFDIGAFNTWTAQSQSPRQDSTPSQSGSLDELFGGSVFDPQGPVDFDVLLKSRSPSSISPVLHTVSRPDTTTSSSSPSASASTQSPESSAPPGDCAEKCPKTKADLERHIDAAGSSMFAPPPPPPENEPVLSHLRKAVDTGRGPMVVCKGATFPPTEKSDKNVEVLSAWRSITSHPGFKSSNVDINALCAEFTDKARCDGTKVVLDPAGINQILEKLTRKGTNA
ncbi:hypothetical protein EVG20_g8492 [Dentipellis fragilis]|uniref:BZIP domain-containing protein n=1 Tax=Dentipellis fragilis TaxID=205917 RepID=A0A4Y9Y5D3_9AGAM|nr:hypothetical protein EVG20_g8492 [Dentipellis fragilis]